MHPFSQRERMVTKRQSDRSDQSDESDPSNPAGLSPTGWAALAYMTAVPRWPVSLAEAARAPLLTPFDRRRRGGGRPERAARREETLALTLGYGTATPRSVASPGSCQTFLRPLSLPRDTSMPKAQPTVGKVMQEPLAHL